MKFKKYFSFVTIIIIIIVLNLFYNKGLFKEYYVLVPDNIKSLIKKTFLYLPAQQKKIQELNGIVLDLEKQNEISESKLKNITNKMVLLQKEKNLINEELFPQTQFLDLEFQEIKLNNFKSIKSNYNRDGKLVSPFYIDTYDNLVFAISKNSEVITIDLENQKKITLIENNLASFGNMEIGDILVRENDLYISAVKKTDNCRDFIILKSKIDNKKLNFQNIFDFNDFDDCEERSFLIGGRLKPFTLNNKQGFLITETDIYFIDVNENSKKLFASGFRNPQGLFVKNDLVLATDHGPRGGDEINKVEENNNYGWPDASYGEEYSLGFTSLEKNKYKKSHSKHGYVEPIFSFIPSIAISEIIELDNNFSKKWQDNYLISSLRAGSIFRVKFDENFERVIFYEKIKVGKRIRDIAYDKQKKLILLALEDETGSLGIINAKN